MFGTEIEFFLYFGDGLLQHRSLFPLELGLARTLSFSFFFLFLFSRDVAVDGTTAVLPGCLPQVVTAA